jgi:hypothetical protein
VLSRHQQALRHQPGLAFRNGLRAAVSQLRDELVAIYSELDGAGDAPLRDELAKLIADRLTAFVQSRLAGVRGDGVAGAAREAHNMAASASMGVGRMLLNDNYTSP